MHQPESVHLNCAAVNEVELLQVTELTIPAVKMPDCAKEFWAHIC